MGADVTTGAVRLTGFDDLAAKLDLVPEARGFKTYGWGPEALRQDLVRRLDVGPMPDGAIEPRQVERLLVLAEVGQVFGEVAGGLGHEVAEVAERLAAHLLVDVILGQFETGAQQRV